jgi:hypothetical protein
MERTAAAAWVFSLCVNLRLSQSKTLSDLVGAALTVGRVSLAEIGRRLTTTTAKHGIKRVWRFTANRRVHTSDVMEEVIARLLRRRKKRLFVSFDWVEVKKFHTLAACAVLRGRALPLLWASYPEWEFHKSQNNLEEGLLRLLRAAVPTQVPLVLLADRGFGRTELARCCQELGVHYVIRIRPDVYVRAERYSGKLLDYPVKRGLRRVLKNVQYRKQHPVTQHIVVYWRSGLPKNRDECWFLMTDLTATAGRLADLYGRRMTIEETFRDHKSRRNGFALRHTMIRHADRFDRLLLILALVYLLLVGLGLHASHNYCPSNWCANTRGSECSLFTIGRRMLDQLQLPPEQALRELQDEIERQSQKWG